MSAETSRSNRSPTAGAVGRSRWPIPAALGLALFVFGLAILVSLLHLRKRIFDQIAGRDCETLDALATQQYLNDKANDESITGLSDVGEQMDLALRISRRLRTVYGVRLFSPQGQFVTAFPAYITETTVPADDLAHLNRLHPVSHFVPAAHLAGQDLLAETNSVPVPLLEVSIPLREPGKNQLEGIAQFLVYGASIAHEYAELDKDLVAQGTLSFFISGSLVTGGLLLAFRRVQQANVRLAERTNNLLKANRELALAAKTSAIGAVSSHLIHGLKNPLSGLRSFVQDRALESEGGEGGDWQLAVASTQRMQSLIDRVVRVLQEQKTVGEYEISLVELVDMLNEKFRPAAQSAGVGFSASLAGDATLSNRDADLILLILENLIQNAIEATPAGNAVCLRVLRPSAGILMEVEDQGPGLRPDLVETLFTPCSSAKKRGSGIGLAISRQLAVHLGATLELKHSGPSGCCFRLVLPIQDRSHEQACDLDLPAVKADGSFGSGS